VREIQGKESKIANQITKSESRDKDKKDSLECERVNSGKNREERILF